MADASIGWIVAIPRLGDTGQFGVLVEMEKKTTIRQLKPYKYYVSITCFNDNCQRNICFF